LNAKYLNTIAMFAHSYTSPSGVHYEISYLDNNKKFSSEYILYVPGQNISVEDPEQGIAYPIHFGRV
jgi:hypothetical protein